MTVWLLLRTLGCLAALHAILKSSTPQGAVAWSLALLVFPALALPFYLLFGCSHFEGYARIFRPTEPASAELKSALEPYRYRPPPTQADWVRVLESLADVPMWQARRLELLQDGAETYRRMHEEIAAAARYVLVLFYKVVDDQAGRALQKLLIAKAREGVRVCFLFDELGSRTLQGPFLRELRQAGVEAMPFRTARGWRHQLQWNFRNHRKVVVVDGRVAMVGGLNVADKYLGLSPYYGPWRDTHVLLSGPAVLGVQWSFAQDYAWTTRRPLEGLTWRPASPPPAGAPACTYFTTGPADRQARAILFYLHCIQAARHRLWLASPYFAPDPSIMQALKMADLRGVDVRILIPPGRYEPHMRLAALSYLPELQGTKIRFYEYPAYNHSKVMLVDDWLAWVGSCNLDNRSLRLNFEGNLVVCDHDFAARIRRMFEHDFARARPLGLEELAAMGPLTRLGSRLARLFLPVL